MVADLERNWLLGLATRCRHLGLTPADAHRTIAADTRGFSSAFRIAQAVRCAFADA